MSDADFEPGVDVIAVNYRTLGDITSFVDSYVDHVSGRPASLCVVDVDPYPEEAVVLRQKLAGMQDAAYLGTTSNVGYGQACNLGSQYATREVLAFFNADVVLTANAVDDCWKALISTESWGVLGPRQVNREGRITHAGIFGSLSKPAHRGWKTSDRGQFSDVRDDAITVSGSAYFVKRGVWDVLRSCLIWEKEYPDAKGAFAPYPHYYEETACSYHAHAHGWKVVYYGPVCIVHEWHQASPVGGWADKQQPVSQRMFRQFCHHHGIPCD